MPLARGVVLISCLPVSVIQTSQQYAPSKPMPPAAKPRLAILRIAAQLGTQNRNRNLKALYSLKLKPQNSKARNPETLLHPHSTLMGHYGALNPKP